MLALATVRPCNVTEAEKQQDLEQISGFEEKIDGIGDQLVMSRTSNTKQVLQVQLCTTYHMGIFMFSSNFSFHKFRCPGSGVFQC